jgi:hypothetical protein
MVGGGSKDVEFKSRFFLSGIFFGQSAEELFVPMSINDDLIAGTLLKLRRKGDATDDCFL